MIYPCVQKQFHLQRNPSNLVRLVQEKIPFLSESDQMTEDEFVNYKQAINDTTISPNTFQKVVLNLFHVAS